MLFLNLMHMLVGDFKIVRIVGDLAVVTLYNNSQEGGYPGFVIYLGRIENEERGHVLIELQYTARQVTP